MTELTSLISGGLCELISANYVGKLLKGWEPAAGIKEQGQQNDIHSRQPVEPEG